MRIPQTIHHKVVILAQQHAQLVLNAFRDHQSAHSIKRVCQPI